MITCINEKTDNQPSREMAKGIVSEMAPAMTRGGKNTLSPDNDYHRVATAIEYLHTHHHEHPTLSEVASQIGLSEYHFQRLFTRWAGVSPKKFLQYISLDHAKRSLDASASVLDATWDAGLSGPGRLHDLFVTLRAVTPGEYKSQGAGLTFRYGFHPTPFGECLLVLSERGVTGLAFVVDGNRQGTLEDQQAGWDAAEWVTAPGATGPMVDMIFGGAAGGRGDAHELPLLLRGTRFQVAVWEALMRIPPGALTTHGRIAGAMGRSGAARAIGGACSANLIAHVIPCHRVIHATGVIGSYRWGAVRKRAILGHEAAGAELGHGLINGGEP
jgi:AraC family transcriptional regulator of adaptative response/methylated-DNA-[protein]-cysteine methyltransferase